MTVRLEGISPAGNLRTKPHGLAADRHLAAGALQPEDDMYFVMSVGNEVSRDGEYRDMSKSAAIKLDGFHRCNFPGCDMFQSRRIPLLRMRSTGRRSLDTGSFRIRFCFPACSTTLAT